MKDNGRFRKGVVILFKALIGKIQTRSWGFPPIVTSIFFIICWTFLIAGLLATWHIYEIPPDQMLSLSIVRCGVFIAAPLALLCQAWLWFRFIGKLYSLMQGTSTIDGFFWRFLPVRSAFLNELDITPTYVFTESQLREEVQTLDEEYGGIREI